MTAQELRDKLEKIIAEGMGHRPVNIMRIEGGVTFKETVTNCYEAEDYDGDIVWLEVGEIQPPEWAGGTGWTAPNHPGNNDRT
jgi:hypothetical protein